MNKLILRFVLILLAVIPFAGYAQTDRQHIRNGNSYFRQKQYDKAEVEYRKAIGKNNENAIAVYNLGCALQAQKKDSLALIQYDMAGKMEQDAERRSQVFYNMGTIYHNQKQYGEAITAYKQALRDNPHDEDARYNLALAKKQQQNQQQQNQNQQNQQSQQNQDKNQDKNKKQQDQNKDKPNQPKKDQQQEQMDKDNAEQLLNAAMQEEKATQQKLKKHMQQQSNRSLEKNW